MESRLTFVLTGIVRCMGPSGLKKGLVAPRRRARIAEAVRAGREAGLQRGHLLGMDGKVRLASHERVQQRPAEHLLEESISQILKDSFEVVKVVLSFLRNLVVDSLMNPENRVSQEEEFLGCGFVASGDISESVFLAVMEWKHIFRLEVVATHQRLNRYRHDMFMVPERSDGNLGTLSNTGGCVRRRKGLLTEMRIVWCLRAHHGFLVFFHVSEAWRLNLQVATVRLRAARRRAESQIPADLCAQKQGAHVCLTTSAHVGECAFHHFLF